MVASTNPKIPNITNIQPSKDLCLRKKIKPPIKNRPETIKRDKIILMKLFESKVIFYLFSTDYSPSHTNQLFVINFIRKIINRQLFITFISNLKNMETSLIAPCGMNCGICMAYLRVKNQCHGCWGDNQYKSPSCGTCVIKNCELLKETESMFCYDCKKYPCTRLKQLDKRYRIKYQMSMLENLENIRKVGLGQFIKMEKVRWMCPDCGGTICVHKGRCLSCN